MIEIKPNQPLKDLIDRYAFLSYQKLADACGKLPNCSKSQIGLLAIGKMENTQKEAKLRKILAEKLPVLMLKNGLTNSEINSELSQIFTEDEYKPMITQRKELPLAVAKYFNFKNAEGKIIDAFSKKPSSSNEVFMPPQLKELAELVMTGIREQGFLAITGDIGAGKDILLKYIQDRVLSDSKLRLIFPQAFDMNRITAANISRAILEEFDETHIPNDAGSRTKKVQRTLARQYKNGTRVALGFNEAHRLNNNTISALKNFLEMNSGGYQDYLGIIAFGQSQLTTMLESNEFREIYERITIVKMPEFKDYSRGYLAHRLGLVGLKTEDLFDDAAIDLICGQAETPLALGNIANQALIYTFGFKQTKVIGEAISVKMHFAKKAG